MNYSSTGTCLSISAISDCSFSLDKAVILKYNIYKNYEIKNENAFRRIWRIMRKYTVKNKIAEISMLGMRMRSSSARRCQAF
jgi:hypothetical protein